MNPIPIWVKLFHITLLCNLHKTCLPTNVFRAFTETKPNLWVHLSKTLTYAIKIVLNNVRNKNLQGFRARKYVKFFDFKVLNDLNVSNVTHGHSF
jgi:hypothetical protein